MTTSGTPSDVRLAPTHEQRAAPVIEIAFGERQRFLDTQPGAPKDHDQATQASPMRVVPVRAHDGDDLLDLRWIGGIAETLVPRRSAGVEAGHRRGRSAATSAIEQQQFGHGPSSGSENETEHPPLASAPSVKQQRARTEATSAYCRSSKAQLVINVLLAGLLARRGACTALGLSDLRLSASCSPTWR
jgi:hypothetical protein